MKEEELAKRLAEITELLEAGEPLDEKGAAEMQDLADALKKIRKVTRANPAPSRAFANRLRQKVLSELRMPQPTVSQQMKEVIARLIKDAEFRNSFFTSPEAVLNRAGFQLSPAEIAALKSMEPEDLNEWFSDLDDRISKSGLSGGWD